MASKPTKLECAPPQPGNLVVLQAAVRVVVVVVLREEVELVRARRPACWPQSSRGGGGERSATGQQRLQPPPSGPGESSPHRIVVKAFNQCSLRSESDRAGSEWSAASPLGLGGHVHLSLAKWSVGQTLCGFWYQTLLMMSAILVKSGQQDVF